MYYIEIIISSNFNLKLRLAIRRHSGYWWLGPVAGNRRDEEPQKGFDRFYVSSYSWTWNLFKADIIGIKLLI